MPLASLADSVSDRIAALYGEAERVLLNRMAKQLASGMGTPNWQHEKLMQYQLLQARMRGDLQRLAGQTVAEVASAVMRAYNTGQVNALSDLAFAGLAQRTIAGTNPVNLMQIQQLVGETVSDVVGQHARILRSVDDVYRQAVAAASPIQLAGAITQREAVQRVLNHAADRGVTGFVDRSGRNWSMRSYAEMATRTAARRAQVSGHIVQLQDHGVDLVIVSDHLQECELCRPWEGKVLSLSGITNITPGVEVAGTLAQAEEAGFLHPGCRHTIGAYIPGFTRLPANTEDPQGDADRQQLRHLERQTRKWRAREAAALTPEVRADAARRARTYQAEIRQHVSTTSAVRVPARERPSWDRMPAAAQPKPVYTIDGLTAQQADDLLIRLVDAGDFEGAERIGELIDARTIQAGAARTWTPNAMDAFNPRTYEWFEKLPPVGQEGFTQQLPQRFRDEFLRQQWAHSRNLSSSAGSMLPTARQMRAEFDALIESEWVALENATNGVTLSREARAAGRRTRDLYRVNAATARSWASEETQGYWDEHGRPDWARFRASYKGRKLDDVGYWTS